MLKKIFKSGLYWSWLALVVVAIDRSSKMWASFHLELYEPHVVNQYFNCTLAHNTGAAFSFLHSAGGWQYMIFPLLAGAISLLLVIWLARLSYRDRWMSIALSLVLGGALGNLWDRLSYLYVIDFLDFHYKNFHFAIFNLADTAICVGAIMVMIKWTGGTR